MIRIICRLSDFSAAANGVDMKPVTEYRTFDIEAPDVERFLTEPRSYCDREVVGVEVRGTPANTPDGLAPNKMGVVQ